MYTKAAPFLLAVSIAVHVFAQSPCDTSGPIPFEDHGKWGYLSANGIALPAKFDSAGFFTDEGAIACVANQCGLIDRTGSPIGPIWDRQHRPFPQGYSEGLAPAIDGDSWGYVDRSLKIVIPLRFLYAGQFDHGMARVTEGWQSFFVDQNGVRVTPGFDAAFDFHEGLAAVMIGNKVGYIRRDGSFALQPQYQSASGIDFAEGLAAIRVDGKVGFMDQSGNIVIQPKYDDVYPFSDGLAPVQLNGKWGYVDKTGNMVVPIKFDIAHMFSEGLASVELGAKWGYIDHTGQFAIPLTFDSAMPFCGGVAAVEIFRKMGTREGGCRGPILRGKNGFIDHAGDYVWRDAEERTLESFCF